jgi:hypothetical protein
MSDILHELLNDRFNLAVFALTLWFFGYLTYRLLLAFPLRMILEKVRIFLRHPELLYGEEHHCPSRNHGSIAHPGLRDGEGPSLANNGEDRRSDDRTRPKVKSMVRKVRAKRKV